MIKTKIDWADRTWNPITGCLNDCSYCYARKISNRFGSHLPKLGSIASLNEPVRHIKYKSSAVCPYPYDFKPTLHKYRLDEPQKIKKPQNIFVCSMADLFGSWIPKDWIDTVFTACEKAPQHNYLFLTKNPERYTEVYFHSKFCGNNYCGITVTNQREYDNSIKYHTAMDNIFISIEPIQGRIDLSTRTFSVPYTETKVMMNPLSGKVWLSDSPQYVDENEHIRWVIVGAETGNRKEKVIPKRVWIDEIADTCKEYNIPLFMKESLRELMGNDFKQEFPEGLKNKTII